MFKPIAQRIGLAGHRIEIPVAPAPQEFADGAKPVASGIAELASYPAAGESERGEHHEQRVNAAEAHHDIRPLPHDFPPQRENGADDPNGPSFRPAPAEDDPVDVRMQPVGVLRFIIFGDDGYRVILLRPTAGMIDEDALHASERQRVIDRNDAHRVCPNALP